MNSRQKGKRGELELARVLRDYGYDAHRGQQYKGGQDSPDVTGLDGYHIECKRVEKADIYGWIDQCIHDAGDDIPLVIWRRNGREWLVITTLDDFMRRIIQ